MEIKTTKEKRIRSRYIISDKLFTEVFYSLYDGYDDQDKQAVYILKFHSQLVTPAFADVCIQSLKDYLFQPIDDIFQLLDMEFDGEDLFLIYKNNDCPLKSLDLYLKQLRNDPQSSEKRYALLLKVSKILLSFEERNLVFGNFSLNNIFISDDNRVVLGPAKINVICYEYFSTSIASFHDARFFPPEFLKSFQFFNTSDIYAFGILAYYVVTYKWPFNQESIIRLKKALMDGPIECRQINSKISDNLNFFIMKSIQFDTKMRWQSFRLIIGVLEGRELVKFEKLSNRGHYSKEFEEDISQIKKNRVGRLFFAVTNIILVTLLLVFTYIGYQSYFSRYSVVVIPDVIDLPLADVKAQLSDLELNVSKVNYNFHPSILEGHVSRIEPPIGRKIKQGRSVKLFVSKGKQEIVVPSLIGKTLQEAMFILDGSSIQIEETGVAFSTSIEEGRIVSQMPLPNQYMFDNGTIQIELSKGMPVNIETIGFLDDDFKKIRVTFQFSDEQQDYQFNLFERLENGNRQKIYTGTYFQDDFFQEEFIIYLILKLN
jgi:hypothetical protein